MQQFNLEYQYQQYLQRVGLTEEQMHEIQRTETRRAFMGACANILFLVAEDIPQLDDEQAVATLDDMLRQAVDFWKKEAHNLHFGNGN